MKGVGLSADILLHDRKVTQCMWYKLECIEMLFCQVQLNPWQMEVALLRFTFCTLVFLVSPDLMLSPL